MAETPTQTAPEFVDDAAETTETAEAADAGEPPEATPVVPAVRPTWAVSPRRTAAGSAAVAALGVAGFVVAAAAARGRGSNLRLHPGEEVAFSVRPRHSLTRYVASLGLWALERRATHYTVTNQRLVVEQGLLHRVVRGVPLSALQHVHVRTGPWEGYVDISGAGLRGRVAGEIGPLRSPVARALAASLARPSGATLAES